MKRAALYLSKKLYPLLAIALVLLLMANVVEAHINPWMSLEQIENELRAKPDDVPLLIDKAHALIQMGRLDDAKLTLDRVDSIQIVRDADTTFAYIFYYHKRGNNEKAFEISDLGIQQFPNNYYQWNIRAFIAMQTERTSIAIEALSKTLSIETKGNSYNYILLTDLLIKRNQEGDKEKVLSLLEEGIAKASTPSDSSQLLQLSISVNTKFKRFDEAINNIEKLEQLYGTKIPYAIKRAEILELAGRYQKAIDAYDTVISMLKAIPREKQNQRTEEMHSLYKERKVSLQEKHNSK